MSLLLLRYCVLVGCLKVFSKCIGSRKSEFQRILLTVMQLQRSGVKGYLSRTFLVFGDGGPISQQKPPES